MRWIRWIPIIGQILDLVYKMLIKKPVDEVSEEVTKTEN